MQEMDGRTELEQKRQKYRPNNVTFVNAVFPYLSSCTFALENIFLTQAQSFWNNALLYYIQM